MWGREANAEFDEKWNGVQVRVFQLGHHFKQKISPYKSENNPFSGLLPEISSEIPSVYGSGDHMIQVYCFRVSLSNHADNQISF